MTENYRAVEIWTAVGAIYLVIISVMAVMFRLVESERTSHEHRRNSEKSSKAMAMSTS